MPTTIAASPSPQGHEQRRVSFPPQAKFGRGPPHQKILTVVLAQHHRTKPESFCRATFKDTAAALDRVCSVLDPTDSVIETGIDDLRIEIKRRATRTFLRGMRARARRKRTNSSRNALRLLTLPHKRIAMWLACGLIRASGRRLDWHQRNMAIT